MGRINFQNLSLDEKRDYIRRLFSPIVQNAKDWKKNLEIFVLSATEEKLDKFYDAIITWNKEYANTIVNEMKLKKWEINKIRADFSTEVVKFKEAEEKKENEKNMDEQLELI